MASSSSKLAALRSFFTNSSVLKTVASIDAYLLPSTDAHQSEYLAEYDFRVKFLSGFSGSNAFTLITKDKALLWTDGRYFIQAARELGEGWQLMKQAQPDSVTPEEWLIRNLPSGATVGFDPEIYTYDDAKQMMSTLKKVGITVVPIEGNLVDPLWTDRPSLPHKKLICLSKEEVGKSVDEKLTDIRAHLADKKTRAIVLLALDDVMWTLNIRGGDIAYNPLAYSVLFISDSEAHLFIDAAKLTDESRAHLSAVTIHPYEESSAFIKKYAQGLEGTNYTVFVPGSTNYAVGSLFESRMYQGSSPVQGMKAKKNSVELAGIRKASIRDAVAQIKYFKWLEEHVKSGGALTEDQAGKKMDEMRTHEDKFVDLSFTTISAVGEHAALPHYHPSNGSDQVPVTTGSVFLLDSGAHYRDGTTDVTRTVWYGNEVPEEFRHHYTLVVIAHIDMALTVFPNGTNGFRLDMASRAAMWREGLDYAHGLGHGVGHFLNVHETPGISYRRYSADSMIFEGVVITIEPGLYIEGKWGIRFENVYEIVRAPVSTSDTFLTFRPLTWLPVQTNILKTDMLEARHKRWLNDYHNAVYRILADELSTRSGDHTELLSWLDKACVPI